MWYNIIGLASVGVIWHLSEPTIRLRDLILGKHEGFFRRLLECSMCSTFWIAIIYSLIWQQNLDIFLACSSAVLAELISQKLSTGTI